MPVSDADGLFKNPLSFVKPLTAPEVNAPSGQFSSVPMPGAVPSMTGGSGGFGGRRGFGRLGSGSNLDVSAAKDTPFAKNLEKINKAGGIDGFDASVSLYNIKARSAEAAQQALRRMNGQQPVQAAQPQFPKDMPEEQQAAPAQVTAGWQTQFKKPDEEGFAESLQQPQESIAPAPAADTAVGQMVSQTQRGPGESLTLTPNGEKIRTRGYAIASKDIVSTHAPNQYSDDAEAEAIENEAKYISQKIYGVDSDALAEMTTKQYKDKTFTSKFTAQWQNDLRMLAGFERKMHTADLSNKDIEAWQAAAGRLRSNAAMLGLYNAIAGAPVMQDASAELQRDVVSAVRDFNEEKVKRYVPQLLSNKTYKRLMDAYQSGDRSVRGSLRALGDLFDSSISAEKAEEDDVSGWFDFAHWDMLKRNALTIANRVPKALELMGRDIWDIGYNRLIEDDPDVIARMTPEEKAWNDELIENRRFNKIAMQLVSDDRLTEQNQLDQASDTYRMYEKLSRSRDIMAGRDSGAITSAVSQFFHSPLTYMTTMGVGSSDTILGIGLSLAAMAATRGVVGKGLLGKAVSTAAGGGAGALSIGSVNASDAADTAANASVDRLVSNGSFVPFAMQDQYRAKSDARVIANRLLQPGGVIEQGLAQQNNPDGQEYYANAVQLGQLISDMHLKAGDTADSDTPLTEQQIKDFYNNPLVIRDLQENPDSSLLISQYRDHLWGGSYDEAIGPQYVIGAFEGVAAPVFGLSGIADAASGAFGSVLTKLGISSPIARSVISKALYMTGEEGISESVEQIFQNRAQLRAEGRPYTYAEVMKNVGASFFGGAVLGGMLGSPHIIHSAYTQYKNSRGSQPPAAPQPNGPQPNGPQPNGPQQFSPLSGFTNNIPDSTDRDAALTGYNNAVNWVNSLSPENIQQLSGAFDQSKMSAAPFGATTRGDIDQYIADIDQVQQYLSAEARDLNKLPEEERTKTAQRIRQDMLNSQRLKNWLTNARNYFTINYADEARGGTKLSDGSRDFNSFYDVRHINIAQIRKNFDESTAPDATRQLLEKLRAADANKKTRWALYDGDTFVRYNQPDSAATSATFADPTNVRAQFIPVSYVREQNGKYVINSAYGKWSAEEQSLYEEFRDKMDSKYGKGKLSKVHAWENSKGESGLSYKLLGNTVHTTFSDLKSKYNLTGSTQTGTGAPTGGAPTGGAPTGSTQTGTGAPTGGAPTGSTQTGTGAPTGSTQTGTGAPTGSTQTGTGAPTGSTQTDTQTDTQTNTQTDTQTDTQTNTQTDTQTDTQTNTNTEPDIADALEVQHEAEENAKAIIEDIAKVRARWEKLKSWGQKTVDDIKRFESLATSVSEYVNDINDRRGTGLDDTTADRLIESIRSAYSDNIRQFLDNTAAQPYSAKVASELAVFANGRINVVSDTAQTPQAVISAIDSVQTAFLNANTIRARMLGFMAVSVSASPTALDDMPVEYQTQAKRIAGVLQSKQVAVDAFNDKLNKYTALQLTQQTPEKSADYLIDIINRLANPKAQPEAARDNKPVDDKAANKLLDEIENLDNELRAKYAVYKQNAQIDPETGNFPGDSGIDAVWSDIQDKWGKLALSKSKAAESILQEPIALTEDGNDYEKARLYAEAGVGYYLQEKHHDDLLASIDDFAAITSPDFNALLNSGLINDKAFEKLAESVAIPNGQKNRGARNRKFLAADIRGALPHVYAKLVHQYKGKSFAKDDVPVEVLKFIYDLGKNVYKMRLLTDEDEKRVGTARGRVTTDTLAIDEEAKKAEAAKKKAEEEAAKKKAEEEAAKPEGETTPVLTAADRTLPTSYDEYVKLRDWELKREDFTDLKDKAIDLSRTDRTNAVGLVTATSYGLDISIARLEGNRVLNSMLDDISQYGSLLNDRLIQGDITEADWEQLLLSFSKKPSDVAALRMALVSAENIIRAHCTTEWAPEGAVPVDARTPAEITGNAFVQWRNQQDMPLTPNEERAYDVLTQEEESNGTESEEGSADTGSSAAAEPGAQPAGNTAEEAGQTDSGPADGADSATESTGDVGTDSSDTGAAESTNQPAEQVPAPGKGPKGRRVSGKPEPAAAPSDNGGRGAVGKGGRGKADDSDENAAGKGAEPAGDSDVKEPKIRKPKKTAYEKERVGKYDAIANYQKALNTLRQKAGHIIVTPQVVRDRLQEAMKTTTIFGAEGSFLSAQDRSYIAGAVLPQIRDLVATAQGQCLAQGVDFDITFNDPQFTTSCTYPVPAKDSSTGRTMLVVNIALDPAMQFVFNEYGIQNDIESAIKSGHTTDLELAKPDPGIPEDELTEDDMPVRVKSLAKLFRQSAPLGIAAVTGHEFAHALYWLTLDENSKEGKSQVEAINAVVDAMLYGVYGKRNMFQQPIKETWKGKEYVMEEYYLRHEIFANAIEMLITQSSVTMEPNDPAARTLALLMTGIANARHDVTGGMYPIFRLDMQPNADDMLRTAASDLLTNKYKEHKSDKNFNTGETFQAMNRILAEQVFAANMLLPGKDFRMLQSLRNIYGIMNGEPIISNSFTLVYGRILGLGLTKPQEFDTPPRGHVSANAQYEVRAYGPAYWKMIENAKTEEEVRGIIRDLFGLNDKQLNYFIAPDDLSEQIQMDLQHVKMRDTFYTQMEESVTGDESLNDLLDKAKAAARAVLMAENTQTESDQTESDTVVDTDKTKDTGKKTGKTDSKKKSENKKPDKSSADAAKDIKKKTDSSTAAAASKASSKTDDKISDSAKSKAKAETAAALDVNEADEAQKKADTNSAAEKALSKLNLPNTGAKIREMITAIKRGYAAAVKAEWERQPRNKGKTYTGHPDMERSALLRNFLAFMNKYGEALDKHLLTDTNISKQSLKRLVYEMAGGSTAARDNRILTEALNETGIRQTIQNNFADGKSAWHDAKDTWAFGKQLWRNGPVAESETESKPESKPESKTDTQPSTQTQKQTDTQPSAQTQKQAGALNWSRDQALFDASPTEYEYVLANDELPIDLTGSRIYIVPNILRPKYMAQNKAGDNHVIAVRMDKSDSIASDAAKYGYERRYYKFVADEDVLDVKANKLHAVKISDETNQNYLFSEKDIANIQAWLGDETGNGGLAAPAGYHYIIGPEHVFTKYLEAVQTYYKKRNEDIAAGKDKKTRQSVLSVDIELQSDKDNKFVKIAVPLPVPHQSAKNMETNLSKIKADKKSPEIDKFVESVRQRAQLLMQTMTSIGDKLKNSAADITYTGQFIETPTQLWLLGTAQTYSSALINGKLVKDPKHIREDELAEDLRTPEENEVQENQTESAEEEEDNQTPEEKRRMEAFIDGSTEGFFSGSTEPPAPAPAATASRSDKIEVISLDSNGNRDAKTENAIREKITNREQTSSGSDLESKANAILGRPSDTKYANMPNRDKILLAKQLLAAETVDSAERDRLDTATSKISDRNTAAWNKLLSELNAQNEASAKKEEPESDLSFDDDSSSFEKNDYDDGNDDSSSFENNDYGNGNTTLFHRGNRRRDYLMENADDPELPETSESAASEPMFDVELDDTSDDWGSEDTEVDIDKKLDDGSWDIYGINTAADVQRYASAWSRITAKVTQYVKETALRRRMQRLQLENTFDINNIFYESKLARGAIQHIIGNWDKSDGMVRLWARENFQGQEDPDDNQITKSIILARRNVGVMLDLSAQIFQYGLSINEDGEIVHLQDENGNAIESVFQLTKRWLNTLRKNKVRTDTVGELIDYRNDMGMFRTLMHTFEANEMLHRRLIEQYQAVEQELAEHEGEDPMQQNPNVTKRIKELLNKRDALADDIRNFEEMMKETDITDVNSKRFTLPAGGRTNAMAKAQLDELYHKYYDALLKGGMSHDEAQAMMQQMIGEFNTAYTAAIGELDKVTAMYGLVSEQELNARHAGFNYYTPLRASVGNGIGSIHKEMEGSKTQAKDAIYNFAAQALRVAESAGDNEIGTALWDARNILRQEYEQAMLSGDPERIAKVISHRFFDEFSYNGVLAIPADKLEKYESEAHKHGDRDSETRLNRFKQGAVCITITDPVTIKELSNGETAETVSRQMWVGFDPDPIGRAYHEYDAGTELAGREENGGIGNYYVDPVSGRLICPKVEVRDYRPVGESFASVYTQNHEKAGKFMRACGMLTRAVSEAMTTFNPLFAPKASVRDIFERGQYCVSHQFTAADGSTVNGVTVMLRMWKNLLMNPAFLWQGASAAMNIAHHKESRNKSRYAKYVNEMYRRGLLGNMQQQFVANGDTRADIYGPTALDKVKARVAEGDADSITKRYYKMLHKAVPYSKIGLLGRFCKLLHQKALGWANFFYNASLAAQYVALRESGCSVDTAAAATANAMDFANQGRYAKYGTKMFSFFNSIMHGSANYFNSWGLNANTISANPNLKRTHYRRRMLGRSITAKGIRLAAMLGLVQIVTAAMGAFCRPDDPEDDLVKGQRLLDTTPLRNMTFLPLPLLQMLGISDKDGIVAKLVGGFGEDAQAMNLAWGIDRLRRGRATGAEVFGSLAVNLVVNTTPFEAPAADAGSNPLRYIGYTAVKANPVGSLFADALFNMTYSGHSLVSDYDQQFGMRAYQTRDPYTEVRSKEISEWLYKHTGGMLDTSPKIIQSIANGAGFGPIVSAGRDLLMHIGDEVPKSKLDPNWDTAHVNAGMKAFGITSLGNKFPEMPGLFTSQQIKYWDGVFTKLGVSELMKADPGKKNKVDKIQATMRAENFSEEEVIDYVNLWGVQQELKDIHASMNDLYDEFHRGNIDSDQYIDGMQELYQQAYDLQYDYMKNSYYYRGVYGKRTDFDEDALAEVRRQVEGEE